MNAYRIGEKTTDLLGDRYTVIGTTVPGWINFRKGWDDTPPYQKTRMVRSVTDALPPLPSPQ